MFRLGNVYGPRQIPHGEAGVVAIFTHHLYTGRSPRLFGYGRTTRDYIYVADVVNALQMAVGVSGTFKISTGIETDVMTIWNLLSDVSITEVDPTFEPLRPGELEHSYMDPSRAKHVFDWSAQTLLENGLAETFNALLSEFDRPKGTRPVL